MGATAGEDRYGSGHFIYGPLVGNPRRVGRALRAELLGLHAARRDDYRVIYAIVEHARRVQIVHIDRCSDADRQRSPTEQPQPRL